MCIHEVQVHVYKILAALQKLYMQILRQMLAQMKRQFLELLSDANFVPPGLHARRVEAEGRRSPAKAAYVPLY